MRFQLLAIGLIAAAGACTPTEPAGPSNPAEDTFAASLNVDIPSMVKLANGDLYYKDIVVGTGTPAADVGKTIVVNYTGYLPDGRVFDSNTTPEGMERPLDDAHLISGWVVGVKGMKPGGTRKLVIGSALAYGAGGGDGPVPIPPNTTIVFDITLKQVK